MRKLLGPAPSNAADAVTKEYVDANANPGQEITTLPTLTTATLSASDLFMALDISNTSDGPSGTLSDLTASDLAAWVAANGASWVSWTPGTLLGSVTNPTLGSGATATGEYLRLFGKTIVARANIQFGTSGIAAGSGDYTFPLPFAPLTSGPTTLVAIATLRASGLTGSTMGSFHLGTLSASGVQFRYPATWPSGTETRVGAAAPAAPTTSSRYEFMVIYEVA